MNLPKGLLSRILGYRTLHLRSNHVKMTDFLQRKIGKFLIPGYPALGSDVEAWLSIIYF